MRSVVTPSYQPSPRSVGIHSSHRKGKEKKSLSTRYNIEVRLDVVVRLDGDLRGTTMI